MDSNLLKPRIKLKYPEFINHYRISEALGWSLAYAFEDLDGIKWYSQFVNRVYDARDNKIFLPIYRMGDGEFSFLLKNSIYDIIPYQKLSWKQKILKTIRRIERRNKGHESGLNRDGLERYSEDEVNFLYNSYINDLKLISEKGILALGFDTGKLYGKFVPYVYDKLIENKIYLNSINYYHVYHVYALFSSTDGDNLLNNQNILIITSLNQEKKSSFDREFHRIGVNRIDYYNISATKSMKEIIDVNKIAKDLDIILIGAGVGSANIIRQLQSTAVPCLDVGAILNNYVNPMRKLERPFMLPDKEFDLARIKFISDKQKRILGNYTSNMSK